MKLFLKILGITFTMVLVLILIALIAGFIYLKNFDIEKYKPQIIKIASDALGRPVNFSDIDLIVSLKEGINFKIADVSIQENPEFSPDYFVFIKKMEAKINVLAYLKRKEVSVPGILIDSPDIKIIRNTNGVFNVQTLKPAPATSDKKIEEGKTEEKPLPSTAKASALPAVLINSMKIENGQVTLIDNSKPDSELYIKDLDLEIKHFSLTKPFDVLLSSAVLTPEKNFNFQSKLQLIQANNEIKLTDSSVNFNFDEIPLATLKNLPILKGIPLPEIAKGQISIQIERAVVNDKGIKDLQADLNFNNGKVSAKEITPGVSFYGDLINLSINDFKLDGSKPAKVKLKAAFYQDQENIGFSGLLILNPKTYDLVLSDGKFETDLALWPVQKIQKDLTVLAQLPVPKHLSGKLQINIKKFEASNLSLKNLLLDTKLENGEFLLEDIVPGIPISLTNTNVSIEDFSLDRPFKVNFQTAYLAKEPNMFFNGELMLDMNKQAMAVSEGKVLLDLASFPLDKIKSSGLIPENTPFPRILTGALRFNIKELVLNPSGISRLGVDVTYTDGSVAIDNIADGISANVNKIDLSIENFALDKEFPFKGSLAYETDETNFSFNGKMKLDAAKQQVTLPELIVSTDLARIPLEKLKTSIAPLKDVPLPDLLKGMVELKLYDLVASPSGLNSFTTDIKVKDGSVSMKEAAPGISVNASDINANITQFVPLSPDKPFNFNLGMAYLSEVPNIKIAGTGTIDIQNQNVFLRDTKVDADLETINMQALKDSVAALKEVVLPQSVKGKFYADIKNAAAGPKGLASLNAVGSLKEWQVKLKELLQPIAGEIISFTATENIIDVQLFEAVIGKGSLKIEGNVEDYQKTQHFDMKAEFAELILSELIEQKDSPIKVEGSMLGNLSAKGKAADLSTITGNGKLEVQDTTLKNFNVLKTVLDKISFLPNVSQRVMSSLPEEYKAKLTDPDTKINTVEAVLSIENGNILIEPISVEADEFIFAGKSTADFEQNYSLNGAVKIPSRLSLAMAEGIQELQYLFDAENNITLPVNVKGKGAEPPMISVTQTAIDMGKGYLKQRGKQELEKVFDQIFGVPQDKNSTDPGTGQYQSPESQEDPSSDMINGLLDSIFNPDL